MGTGELSLLEGASEVGGDTMGVESSFLMSFSSCSLSDVLRRARFRLTISSKYSSLFNFVSTFFAPLLAPVDGEGISSSPESSFFSSSFRSFGLWTSSGVTCLAFLGGECFFPFKRCGGGGGMLG